MAGDDTGDKGGDVTPNSDDQNNGDMYGNSGNPEGKVVAGTGEDFDKLEREALDEEHGTGEDEDNKGEVDDNSDDGGDDDGSEGSEDGSEDDRDESPENNFGYDDQTGVEVFGDVISVLIDKEVPRAEAEAIFGDAMKTGDLGNVDVEALKEKVGEATSKLIMRQLGDYQTRETARVEENNQKVYEAAGGQEEWNKIVEWSKDAYTQDEADQINGLLQQGGKAADLAVQDIISKYKSSDNYEEAPEVLDGDGGEDSQGQPMTRAEYYEAYEAEKDKVGGGNPQILRALDARRRAGIAKGL